MEFWPENQGQTPLYSKFGTVPGRNCTHNYHDRHQVPHYPLYYGEQQDQSRESSYWTVPGSRAGGAPQEYSNWTDPELTTPTSSHFPFILDRHAQQHQDLGDYQSHEARDREWTAAQRAAREYERGFLREGWQRRWEPCGPVRYTREVSTKRSDSSYRELEAWAARYSHSLPRRRRIEAELRGATQGLLESSRDNRSGTDPRVAALQQVRQSANIRDSGLWDRPGRQQAPTYYPPQTPASDTSHMLDMKEKTGHQRRMFSQPPGYIAPPPYDSPHKGSPVLHHCDTSWEQEGKKQSYWSQPALRKQEVPVELQDHRKGEKEEFTKPDGNQISFPELEGLTHRRKETDASQTSSPFSVQETYIEREGVLSLQQQQVLQAVENKKTNEEPSSKVIEGRKFRLNRKRGGLTIFCLVSRIAGPTETPSLPLLTSQTNIQNTELGDISKDPSSNETHKLADEVDFRAPTFTEQSNTSDARQKETPTCIESEMLEDNVSNKVESDVVSPEIAKTNDADATVGRQVAQTVLKYPLWREPSITSRTEPESISTCLKAHIDGGESGVLQEDSGEGHPIDFEVTRLDIKPDTESEDGKGLLVIDTSCVVVKMELIPSPKKEHVHYLQTEHSQLDRTDSESELNEDVTTDQNTGTNLHIKESPETKLDSDLMETTETEIESEISSLCMSSSSVSERETLEERAERILGIPLHDCTSKQQPEDATLLLDSCVEDQHVEASPGEHDDTDEQIPEDIRDKEQSQNQLEVGQTEDGVCSQENDDAKDPVANEGGGDVAGLQDQVSNMSEENDIDSQIETDIKPSLDTEMTEDPKLKTTSEEGTTEEDESGISLQCLSPPTNLSNSCSLSDSDTPNPALSLTLSTSDLTPLRESNTEEGPDPELIALNSTENLAPRPETSLPVPIGSTDHSPSSSTLFIDQTAEEVSGVENQDEEGETSQLINNEISESAKDTTEELVFESGQPEDAACGEESNVTDEADKDPADQIMEQTLNISKETAIEVDVLQRQLECVQVEDVACVNESYTTEEQLPKEVSEDPSGILEETTSQENVADNQTEVNMLQQQFDKSQEEDAYHKDSCMTEEQLPQEVNEDPTSLLEQTLSTENATVSEPQTEPSKTSPAPPSDSDCGVPQSPHESNETDVSLLEMDSVCPSSLNPAAGIPETVPSPLNLDSCAESIQFSSSSSCTDSSQVLPSSSSTLPPEDESADPDSPLKEEPQYPKSLWDAVNRIRKHTAPDSENEEEEVSELWDPESAGDDLGRPDVVVSMDSDRIVFGGVEQREVSTEDVELGQIQQDPCHEEPSGHAEDDTLSISSTISHGSGETVIVADEDEVEETPADVGTESKTGKDKEFQMAEGEQCFSVEVKDETAAEEKGDNDRDDSNTIESEEATVEVVNITRSVEKMETEIEESEEVVFMPLHVSDD